MPTKRSRQSSSPVSLSPRSLSPPSKRLRTTPVPELRNTSQHQSYGRIKVYIVQEKLDTDAISELYTLIDSQQAMVDSNNAGDTTSPARLKLELCTDVNQADVIITAVRMRKRLERHLDWRTAVSIL